MTYQQKCAPDWIVGFTDAEGHFSIIQSRNKIRCRFIISQNARSIHALHVIKDYFGVGHVNCAGGQMYAYTVGNLKDIYDKIIPFFEKYTLHSNKYFDWLLFRYALQAQKDHSSHNSFDLEQIH